MGIGMDETELRLRELELRERQLAFEREKWLTEQDQQQAPRTDWLKAFGTGALAVLVPVSGVFLDVQQAERQAFESRMSNLREGFDFYFNQRQALKDAGDAADVEAVAHTLSTAFPEAYCAVRADLHRIALTKGATPEENADLVWSILARDTVQLPAPKSELWVTQYLPWRRADTLSLTCDPIVRAQPLAAAPDEPFAAPEDAKAGASTAPAPELAKAAKAYTVYLHVSAGRDPGALATERPYLAERGYRLAAGSAPMAFPFQRARVTFYEDAQEGDAQALASWLGTHFAGEGLTFQAVRSQRRSLREGLLEIWIPAAPPKEAPPIPTGPPPH